MRTYKVIALTCTGKGGKIFRLEDEVRENQFNEGHAESLVKQKFLERLTGDADTVAPKEELNLNVRTDDENQRDNTKKTDSKPKQGAGEVTKKVIDDISKKELIKYLTENKIDFDGQDGKTELYKLYKEN